MTLEEQILDLVEKAGDRGVHVVLELYKLADRESVLRAAWKLRKEEKVIFKGDRLFLFSLNLLTRRERIDRYLAKRFTAPKKHCHACKKPLPPRRSRWCSDECSDLYLGLVSAQYGRVLAYKKSQACALCAVPLFVQARPGDLGFEGEWEYVSTYSETHQVKRTTLKPVGFEIAPESKGGFPRWVQTRTPEMQDAELDHIVPIVEGGDHDWHNLRLLCKPCHKKETAALAERRAKARKK